MSQGGSAVCIFMFKLGHYVWMGNRVKMQCCREGGTIMSDCYSVAECHPLSPERL